MINGKPVTEKTLFAECQARGIPCQSHESDLYIPSSTETYQLCKHFGKRPEAFTNQVEGGTWLDVPFAYDPWWQARGCAR